MRFLFKTDYEDDIRLLPHSGYVYSYGLLLAVLLIAPYVLSSYLMSQLVFVCIYATVGVGLMILPAGIARFWSRDLTAMICIAVIAAAVSGYAGLVLSFQSRVPSGPAIILVATVIYIVSVLFGRVGGIIRQMFPGRHLEA